MLGGNLSSRGEIDNHTLFWSDRREQWLALVNLLDDIYPKRERVDQMRQAGIERVEVLGTGSMETDEEGTLATLKQYRSLLHL